MTMGRYIYKAARDHDLFAEWSTIVEAPTFIGTHAEMLAYLKGSQDSRYADAPEDRLRRAERTGTSALRDPAAPGYTGPLDGAWDDAGEIVEQRGWLPRSKLADFLRAYSADREKAYAMLEPFDDD